MRRHPAELLGVQLNAHKASFQGQGVDLSGLFQQNFPLGIFHLGLDLFFQVDIEFTRFRVDFNVHILIAVIVFTGRGDSFLDLIQHELHRDSLFLFQKIQGDKQFFVALLFRFFLPSHFSDSLLLLLSLQRLILSRKTAPAAQPSPSSRPCRLRDAGRILCSGGFILKSRPPAN